MLNRFWFDLSAAEAIVPARGKALVPTDLSIAIPEGTYARIGEQDLRWNALAVSFGSPFSFALQVFDEMLL